MRARWDAVPRAWRSRILLGTLAAVVGYAAAVLLRFDPRPGPYVVMAAVVLALGWLVLDTVDAPAAEWVPRVQPAGDRVDEATSDLRVLSSHQQAREPSETLRERLVALARARDPVLAEDLRRELDPLRRLSPGEIDRILTRIEEVRD
ncbi:hypothetical protein GCM10009641_30830 [Mycobacterium cookii]|uniref:Uncharacterized protein n=1 Tax=Nocardioides furvisabuli TaxID=375542 RepID=A0ABP5JAG5_9ACTN|nr:hypothetical protein [Nocardioides furvisabuli]